MTTELTWEDCLNFHNDGELGECEGPVEYHSTDPGVRPAFPRCRRHWEARLAERERSIERYADSDVPPAWFDPTIAGERWDDDY